jgi:hypothetical protein
MTRLHLEEIEFMLNHYGNETFSFQMCPPLLFAEMVNINYLREQAAKNSATGDLLHMVQEILSRIDNFSPENWAETKPASRLDWVLAGKVFQTAVSLFCISSLQSVLFSSSDEVLRTQSKIFSRVLHMLLAEALVSPKIKRTMLWPLVVLGTVAVNGDEALRAFVEKKLTDMSYYLGTNVPLTAKFVLKTFWNSGNTNWDACFDRSYGFITQIMLDMKEILA